MKEDKKRFRVRDGYHFQFVPEIRDAKGNIHNFKKDSPAGPGSVVEVTNEQILGQEHKLEMVEAVILKCNNSGCGKKFETKAINLAYAYCPNCGGRGGDMVTAKTALEIKREKKKDKDRQDLSKDEGREVVVPGPPSDNEDNVEVATDAEDEEENQPTAKKSSRGRRKKR